MMQQQILEPSILGTVKDTIAAFGLEYWLALPLLVAIAVLKLLLDEISLDVKSIGGYIRLGPGFSERLEDWAWRIASIGIALILAFLGVKWGVLEGHWGVIGTTHGALAPVVYHLLKKVGVLSKIGLAKENGIPTGKP